ncbi:MAG TPA: PEGA domain-containing protein [Terriglobales bacterium]
MKIDLRRLLALAIVLAAGIGVSSAYKHKDDQASKGQVYVSVHPQEAYIWVDGKPVSHRSSKLDLAPGEHTITVANYGFEPMSQKVTVAAGSHQRIDAQLKPAGGPVSGPWGRIQIEGVPGDALVFVNGTTPGFFVGHADEMNNNIFNMQRLILPTGKHQLFIVRRSTDQPIWSGPVDVQEDRRLIVYVKGQDKAKLVYKKWDEGKKLASLRRFDTGIASATIVVAPVTAHLAADTPNIRCDQTGKLTWSSANAAQTVIMANNQKVAAAPAGTVEVDPKATTNYQLRAAGPGGVVTQDATMHVDNTVKTSLTISQPELHFVKVGDQIKQQDTANLVWSASNADSVSIDRIGSVSGANGTQTVQATPSNTNEGEVNETQVYKITAKNDCGGSDTSMVAVHLTGSIEPAVVAEAPPPPELPHTATPLPLLALFGLASLGTGAFLRMRSKR